MRMYCSTMNIKTHEICLAHSLRRADRVVSQLYNQYFASLGIRVTQFSVLRALHLMGSTTAVQIQDALVMDQTTVSRALTPLIRDGYITSAEGATKREKALSLTPEGKALYTQALGPWDEAQKMLREKLGQGKDEILMDLSRQIVTLKE